MTDVKEEWTKVQDEVLAAIQPGIEKAVLAATDRIYDTVLSSVQDYFAENVRWNIESRLSAAERGRRSEWERAETLGKKAQVLEDHVARLGRLMTSEEWISQRSSGVSGEEAIQAMDREILAARAALQKARGK